jgi:hypothetical protein
MLRDADVKRLRMELRTIWEALYEAEKDTHRGASKKELRELTRARFLQIVDDAAREIAAEG